MLIGDDSQFIVNILRQDVNNDPGFYKKSLSFPKSTLQKVYSSDLIITFNEITVYVFEAFKRVCR